MERNVKLYPIYRLFSADILFYYAISILFLTNTKHFSLSQVAMVSSVYAIASIFAQIPASIIVDRLGLRTTMIIGNILCMMWGLFYILVPNFNIFIIGEVVSGIGFALKGVSETPFLYASLKNLNKVSQLSEVEGKGSALYYIVEALASIVAGYLFTINNYLPIIFAISCFVIATVIAFYMKPIKTKSSEIVSSKERIKVFRDGFKFIIKSKRLNALLLFACVFYGTLALGNLYIKTYFNDINTPANVFGYIFAGASVLSSIGATVQGKLEKKSKNRTLSSFSVSFLLSFIFIGICSLIFKEYITLLVIGIMVFMFQSFYKGAYFVVMKDYISRYTTSTIRPKIMSIYNLANNLGSAVLLFIASKTIDLAPTSMSYIIFGFFLFIMIILILNYMSSKVGLEPDKYTKRDRYDLEH